MGRSKEKSEILYGFVRRMKEEGRTFCTIGRNAVYAARFLDEAGSAGLRSYRKYCDRHAAELAEQKGMRQAIDELMAYAGAGTTVRRRKQRRQDDADGADGLPDDSARADIDAFIAWLSEERDYSPSYYQTMRIGMTQYFRHAREFDQAGCRSFVAALEAAGKSPNTVRLRILAMERYAEFRRKKVSVKRPRLQKRESTENVPTCKEVDALLSLLDARGDRLHRLWLRILTTTGVRVSEFRKLTWEDVLAGEAVIRGKGSKYRTLFIQPKLVEEARAYVRDTGATGPVAVSRSGEPITDRGISSLLKNWGRLAGVPQEKMHCHAFRHYFAKMYLAGSKDVVRLSELLGHESVDTTRIYLQQSRSEQRREFNKVVVW